MPVSERSIDPASRCFVLTEVRTVEGNTRSALIDGISGRDLTARMAQPPQPGTCVRFNLGEQGWIDGVVRWADGKQLRVELQGQIDWSALLTHEATTGKSPAGHGQR